MWKKPPSEYLVLAAVLLVALGLRLVNISAEPYWGDEVLSLDIVRHFATAGEMLRYVAQVEFHPPLYYLLLKPWIALFGEAEGATRSLSLIFSLGTVVMTWLLGRRLFSGTKAGIIAASIVAVLPIQIEFGQEARPYAIFCFFTMLAAYAMLEHLRTKKLAWAACYAASAALALYLHYSAAFGVIALTLWWLIAALREPAVNRSKALLAWLSTHAVLFLAFFPWLTPLLYKLSLGGFDILGAARRALPFREPGSYEQAVELLVWATKAEYVPQIVMFAGVAFKLAFIVALVGLVSKRDRISIPGERESLRFLAWFAAITVLLFALSPQSIPYTRIYVRHAIVASIPIALLIGWLAARVHWKQSFVILSLLAASLLPHVADILGDDSLWDYDHRLEEAGQYVTSHYKEGDLMIAASGFMRTDLSHYLPPAIPVDVMLPIPYYGEDVWDSRETLGIIENESQVRIRKVSPAEINEKLDRLMTTRYPSRVWLYGFVEDDIDVHGWFEKRGWRHAFRSLGGVLRLDLYVRP